MGSHLIILGIILIFMGLLISGTFGFTKLPLDIVISRPNFTFYFPIGTMIAISVILSIIFWIIRK